MPDEPVVFVVDDHPVVRASITALLDLSGFHVKTFVSAEEFLISFEPRMCGCLLLDVRLPGMSGVELLKTIRARGATLPVLMVSGHASTEVRNEAMSHGALAFLDKPVDSRELIKILRSCIGPA